MSWRPSNIGWANDIKRRQKADAMHKVLWHQLCCQGSRVRDGWTARRESVLCTTNDNEVVPHRSHRHLESLGHLFGRCQQQSLCWPAGCQRFNPPNKNSENMLAVFWAAGIMAFALRLAIHVMRPPSLWEALIYKRKSSKGHKQVDKFCQAELNRVKQKQNSLIVVNSSESILNFQHTKCWFVLCNPPCCVRGGVLKWVGFILSSVVQLSFLIMIPSRFWNIRPLLSEYLPEKLLHVSWNGQLGPNPWVRGENMNQSHTDGGEEKLQKPKTVKHYETFRKQTALPSQTLSSGSARGLDSSGALDGGELFVLLQILSIDASYIKLSS